MKTYLLIMTMFNPASDQWDSYLLDYNLSAQDCIEALNDFATHHNPNTRFTCKAEK